MIRPNAYFASVHDINYIKLKEKGIELLCFDLDNTLDKPDRMTQDVDKDIEKLLLNLKKDFEIFVISNNSIPGRVYSFTSKTNLNYLENAKKPFLKKYKTCKNLQKYEPSKIVFIGDKIVTDIIGGNRYGSYTILVDPIEEEVRHWYSAIMKGADYFFAFLIKFKKGVYFDEQ